MGGLYTKWEEKFFHGTPILTARNKGSTWKEGITKWSWQGWKQIRGEGRDKQAKQLTCKWLFSWTNFSTNGSNFFRVAFSLSSRSFSGACDGSTLSARVLSLVVYFSKLKTTKYVIHMAETNLVLLRSYIVRYAVAREVTTGINMWHGMIQKMNFSRISTYQVVSTLINSGLVCQEESTLSYKRQQYQEI